MRYDPEVTSTQKNKGSLYPEKQITTTSKPNLRKNSLGGSIINSTKSIKLVVKSFYSTKSVKKKLGRAFLCSGVFLGVREGGEAEFQVIFLLLKTEDDFSTYSCRKSFNTEGNSTYASFIKFDSDKIKPYKSHVQNFVIKPFS